MTTTPSTEIVPVSPQAKAEVVAALRAGQTVEEILARITAPAPTSTDVQPTVPTAVALKPAQIEALDRLPVVYGQVRVTEPRELSPLEREALLAERDQIDALLGLAKRKEVIREYLATDLDRVAERTGAAVPGETPRDKAGHYLLDGEVPVPGTGRKITRTLNRAKVGVSNDRLLAAYEADRLTRAQFLAVTREVRVYDPAKAQVAVVSDPGLLHLLAEHATVTAPPVAVVQPRPDHDQE